MSYPPLEISHPKLIKKVCTDKYWCPYMIGCDKSIMYDLDCAIVPTLLGKYCVITQCAINTDINYDEDIVSSLKQKIKLWIDNKNTSIPNVVYDRYRCHVLGTEDGYNECIRTFGIPSNVNVYKGKHTSKINVKLWTSSDVCRRIYEHYSQIAVEYTMKNNTRYPSGMEYIDYNCKYFESCLNDYMTMGAILTDSINKSAYKISMMIEKLVGAFKLSCNTKITTGIIRDSRKELINPGSITHIVNWGF